MKRTYVYSISKLCGEKIIGGTVSASSMDDAVRCLISRHGLKIVVRAVSIRPFDGEIVQDCEWRQDGRPVHVCVYALANSFFNPKEKE